MNDGPHTLNRDRARAILNRCAVSIHNITTARGSRPGVGAAVTPAVVPALISNSVHIGTI